MFKDEVIALLKDAPNACMQKMFHQDFDEEISEYDDEETRAFKIALEAKKITVKHVQHYGGEGEGEQYWTVYSFSNASELVFITFDGYYQSYDGATYRGFYEVEPVEKLVTFYERKA